MFRKIDAAVDRACGRRHASALFWLRLATIAFLLGMQASLPAARAQGVADAGGIPEKSIAPSLPDNGDPFGRRAALASRGITYSFLFTNDVLANLDGGQKRGVVDQGKLEGALTVDLEKFAGLKGLTFYANGFDIYNTGRFRSDYIGGINTISSIEARRSIRLSELWLEQKLLDDKVTFRFGQLAADTEFFFSEVSTLFLQSDWPTIAAAALPSGGPAYPLSTPGVRLKYDPTPNYSLLLAMFNGDPAGPGAGDEQLRNRNGLNFRVQDPPLFLGELQWRWNQQKEDKGLAGTIKAGAWGHVGRFADVRLASDGTLLANPAGNGLPLRHQGDFGLYGIIDQQIYRPAGGAPDSGVSIFGRISASPSDRNPVDFQVDGGIVVAGPIPGRPDDRFGVAGIFAQYSRNVGLADRDAIAFSGIDQAVRDFEANIEVTYQAQVVPG